MYLNILKSTYISVREKKENGTSAFEEIQI